MRKSKPKLYLRFTTPEGKQSGFYRAAFDSRARIRPYWCVVNGTPEHHSDAYYYRRIRRPDGKLSWESLGKDYVGAWGTTTADTKLTKTEKVPGLDLYGLEPAIPAPSKAKDSYRLHDEAREYLTNAAKLAAKTPGSTSGWWIIEMLDAPPQFRVGFSQASHHLIVEPNVGDIDLLGEQSDEAPKVPLIVCR